MLELLRRSSMACQYPRRSIFNTLIVTFAFEPLAHEPEQHFAAEVAECGRLVRVHRQRVRALRRRSFQPAIAKEGCEQYNNTLHVKMLRKIWSLQYSNLDIKDIKS